jgi:hypothetical protein
VVDDIGEPTDAMAHLAGGTVVGLDLNPARQLLDDNGLASSPIVLTALEAVREVLLLSTR